MPDKPELPRVLKLKAAAFKMRRLLACFLILSCLVILIREGLLQQRTDPRGGTFRRAGWG